MKTSRFLAGLLLGLALACVLAHPSQGQGWTDLSVTTTNSFGGPQSALDLLFDSAQATLVSSNYPFVIYQDGGTGTLTDAGSAYSFDSFQLQFGPGPNRFWFLLTNSITGDYLRLMFLYGTGAFSDRSFNTAITTLEGTNLSPNLVFFYLNGVGESVSGYSAGPASIPEPPLGILAGLGGLGLLLLVRLRYQSR